MEEDIYLRNRFRLGACRQAGLEFLRWTTSQYATLPEHHTFLQILSAQLLKHWVDGIHPRPSALTTHRISMKTEDLPAAGRL